MTDWARLGALEEGQDTVGSQGGGFTKYVAPPDRSRLSRRTDVKLVNSDMVNLLNARAAWDRYEVVTPREARTFWQAAVDGDARVVQRKIEQGEHRVNDLDTRGRAVIHEAAANGHTALVKLLVEKLGADKNKKTWLGRDSPLHCAAANGRRAVVFYLLSHGADPDTRNRFGMTPLHVVVGKNTARLLIEFGADLDARTRKGEAVDEVGDPDECRMLTRVIREERKRLKAEQREDEVALQLEKARREAEAKERADAAERDEFLASQMGFTLGQYREHKRAQAQKARAARRRASMERRGSITAMLAQLPALSALEEATTPVAARPLRLGRAPDSDSD